MLITPELVDRDHPLPQSVGMPRVDAALVHCATEGAVVSQDADGYMIQCLLLEKDASITRDDIILVMAKSAGWSYPEFRAMNHAYYILTRATMIYTEKALVDAD